MNQDLENLVNETLDYTRRPQAEATLKKIIKLIKEDLLCVSMRDNNACLHPVCRFLAGMRAMGEDVLEVQNFHHEQQLTPLAQRIIQRDAQKAARNIFRQNARARDNTGNPAPSEDHLQ